MSPSKPFSVSTQLPFFIVQVPNVLSSSFDIFFTGFLVGWLGVGPVPAGVALLLEVDGLPEGKLELPEASEAVSGLLDEEEDSPLGFVLTFMKAFLKYLRSDSEGKVTFFF